MWPVLPDFAGIFYTFQGRRPFLALGLDIPRTTVMSRLIERE